MLAPLCGLHLPSVSLRGNQVWGRNPGIHVKSGCQVDISRDCFGWCFVEFCFGLLCTAVSRTSFMLANLSQSQGRLGSGDHGVVSWNLKGGQPSLISMGGKCWKSVKKLLSLSLLPPQGRRWPPHSTESHPLCSHKQQSPLILAQHFLCARLWGEKLHHQNFT